MKKLSLFLMFSLFVFTMVGQNAGNKIETKYYRPSITLLYCEPTNANESMILNKVKGLELRVSKQFDDHSIDFRLMNNGESINDFLFKASNAIMSKWWNRDNNGNFNTSLIAKRGEYSAIDADAMQAKASAVDHREMIGEQLVGRTYAFLYKILRIRTMEEVYDEIDAKNRKNQKEFKPVKRTDEGYVLGYSVSAYKLIFNDSVASVFYNEYWTDEKNHDESKVAKWQNASFPMKFVTELNGAAASIQPKDPNSPVYQYTKKRTMSELLEALPEDLQNDESSVMDKFGELIEDFRIKSSVFKTNPLSAKIGTKEGIKVDDRYFVYEIALDKNNNQKKNRMGVARVKTVSNNDNVATGNTIPSIFQQQGGRNLYEGMLMERHLDRGLFYVGYSAINPNLSLGGIKLGLDALMPSMGIRGLYVGLDFTFNVMDNINPGHITAMDGTKSLGYVTDGTSKFSGYTYALGINFSKEMYFTKKGNVFLKPSIGCGFANYTFTSSTDKTIDFEIPDPKDSEKKIQNPWYSWSSLFVPVSIGFGINLFPAVVLEVKPEIIARLGSSTDQITLSNGDKKSYDLKQNTSTANDDMKNWGFNNIDKLSYYTSLIFSLKYRF